MRALRFEVLEPFSSGVHFQADGVARACCNNGYANARAACGVFFNINSIHNKAFLVRDRRPTS